MSSTKQPQQKGQFQTRGLQLTNYVVIETQLCEWEVRMLYGIMVEGLYRTPSCCGNDRNMRSWTQAFDVELLWSVFQCNKISVNVSKDFTGMCQNVHVPDIAFVGSSFIGIYTSNMIKVTDLTEWQMEGFIPGKQKKKYPQQLARVWLWRRVNLCICVETNHSKSHKQ